MHKQSNTRPSTQDAGVDIRVRELLAALNNIAVEASKAVASLGPVADPPPPGPLPGPEDAAQPRKRAPSNKLERSAAGNVWHRPKSGSDVSRAAGRLLRTAAYQIDAYAGGSARRAPPSGALVQRFAARVVASIAGEFQKNASEVTPFLQTEDPPEDPPEEDPPEDPNQDPGIPTAPPIVVNIPDPADPADPAEDPIFTADPIIVNVDTSIIQNGDITPFVRDVAGCVVKVLALGLSTQQLLDINEKLASALEAGGSVVLLRFAVLGRVVGLIAAMIGVYHCLVDPSPHGTATQALIGGGYPHPPQPKPGPNPPPSSPALDPTPRMTTFQFGALLADGGIAGTIEGVSVVIRRG